MLFQPKVSIVIPVYNGSNYLSRAIDSALSQTYNNIEILVINDGSDDNGATHDIALSYGDKVLYFEKENGGVSTALNLGIKKMTGEYFSWLSHDDEYYSNKIEEQILVLQNCEDKQVVLYSDVNWIDNNNLVINGSFLSHIPNKTGLKMVFYTLISGCSLLIPKKCFTEIGDFNEDLPVTQDYDMWFRLAKHYVFTYISSSLVKVRIHSEQTTNTYSQRLEECNKLYIDMLYQLTIEDIKLIEDKEILFYLKLIIVMDTQGYTSASSFLYKNKLANYPKTYIKLMYIFYSNISTSWFNKVSFFTFLTNPVWTTQKLVFFIKYKVLKRFNEKNFNIFS